MAKSDLLNELDAYVSGVVDDLDELEEPPPPPEDVAGANLLLRRIRRHERHIDEARAVAEKEIGRIQEFTAERVAVHQRAIAFIERSIEQWTRERFKVARTKTHKVTHGELRLRPVQETLIVTDEAAATAWLREHEPELVRTKYEVQKRETLAAFEMEEKPDGEPPAGSDAPDGARWHRLRIVDPESGEVSHVPGLMVQRTDVLRFGYTTNKGEEPDE